jgi:hypothetical protein
MLTKLKPIGSFPESFQFSWAWDYSEASRSQEEAPLRAFLDKCAWGKGGWENGT